MDFLDHEMRIAALFGRLVVPGDGEGRFFDGVFVDVHHGDLVGLENGNLPGLHDKVFLCVFDEGGNVAGHEIFPVAKTNQKGVFLAHTDNLSRFILADDAKGIGAANVTQRLDDGVLLKGLPRLLHRKAFHPAVGRRQHRDAERLKQVLSTGSLRGDDITLTLDSSLCAYAASLFPQDKSGAIVVMNYKTGEIYALQSFPNYDPQSGKTVTVRQALNRATRWLSAPGSTFKVITLAAALQSLPGAAESSYTCTGGVSFGEHQRVVTDYGAAAHGTLTLKDAFMKSCNSTFAMLACQMGDKALRKTAQSFGLDDAFTFRDLVVENSAYASSSAALLGADLAWTGAGQNQLAVTPLHMCMVAAAVANDGVMMEPRLLLRAVGAEGAERQTFEPAVYRTAMDAQTAATVREYMRAVVTGGTGRSAAVRGLTVCAKTGTAEIDTQEKDNAWFIGFIDDDAYPFAVCVAVENAGTGGAVAAPIAQKIFARLAGK